MDAPPLRPLLLLLLSSLLLRSELAAGDYLNAAYQNCLLNATSLTTTFTRNLNTSLQTLTTLSSNGTKNATTSAGSGSGIVYAMFQCRGDQTTELCSECMQSATARLPQNCPKSVGARIQLDGCYLRYNNQSFFVLDTNVTIGLCNTIQTSDAVALAAMKAVVENVTSQAPKQGGFASATEDSVYAAAQCLGYLNETDCSKCLSTAKDNTCDLGALGKQVHLASCYYRYETQSFLETSSPPLSASPAPSPVEDVGSPPPQVSAPHPSQPNLNSQPKPSGSKKPIVVGVAVGVFILAAFVCAIVVWRYKASKIKGEKLGKVASWSRKLLQTKAQVFSLGELEEATSHFHPTNKLGVGGFGVVYKGILSGGEQVAIKKLSIGRQDGKQEFLNEVNLITSVQHKNLIRLLGCCVEGPERILVYEYLPNKSLDMFLFGENGRLNWPTRYGIILGMAKGLAYLHEESHVRIIHRDIKPGNILLDNELNPVIADFGIARLVKENATHINTRVAGTLGYLAPEYAICGDLSEKVDVFSFGLVSLEIVTGKQNRNSGLLTWVWENYQHGKALEVVDEKLGNAFSPQEAIRAIHVALLCTQESAKQRPAMSRVTLLLSGTSDILEIPTRPTFLEYNESVAPVGDVTQQFTSASSTSSSSAYTGGQVSGVSGGMQSFSEIVEPR